MDIKELDKKQLILLTLLITFIVSIATGIVTVSLMNQMPKSVPQTINNVIQRTIEKVTTVEVPVSNTEKVKDTSPNNSISFLGSDDALVSIYKKDKEIVSVPADSVDPEVKEEIVQEEIKPIGQGVIISDVGLILIDSSLITDLDLYKVVLNQKDFDLSILKRFNNGFTIMKISSTKEENSIKKENKTQ